MKVYHVIYNCTPDGVGYLSKGQVGLRLVDILLSKNPPAGLLEWLNIEVLEVK